MKNIDEEIDLLADRVGRLESRQTALFFAVCGERFCDLYRQFAEKHGVASTKILRFGLDAVWEDLGGGQAADWADEIATIERSTPHADDIDNINATLVQDACMLVEAALRSMNSEDVADSVEFAIEAFRVTICYDETGYLQLGSGSEAEEFEQRLRKNPTVQSEISLLKRLAKRVAAWTEADVSELKLLREFGSQNAVNLSIQ